MTPVLVVKRGLERALFALFIAAIVVYALFPFYWAIVTSLRTGSEIFRVDLLPHRFTLENYRYVLTSNSL